MSAHVYDAVLHFARYFILLKISKANDIHCASKAKNTKKGIYKSKSIKLFITCIISLHFTRAF